MTAYLEQLINRSRTSFKQLKRATTLERNQALTNIADSLAANTETILAANQKDVDAAKSAGMSAALVDRLTLTNDRVKAMAQGVIDIREMPDPIGQIVRGNRLKNGMKVEQVREPLGVIAMIFEARPNVTVDAAVLSIKSANSCILRGGKEALNSNKVLADLIRGAIAEVLPMDCVILIENTDHSLVDELLQARGLIDLVIPRGSARLINKVVSDARVPVIETGAGICTAYVSESANLDDALNIVINAKTQRPSVCNALENLLVHERVVDAFIPKLYERLTRLHTELRGDSRMVALTGCTEATLQDFDTEYLDYILSAKTVASTAEAIAFINEHGTHHSDVILTEDYREARTFLADVDSACVYVNASTRFSDGAEFGYGAEIGISTQKMHARGPFGLTELTTTKYLITGEGQVRP
ncbi:MAG: glutamate-5-semialdehyde dehydrogenase [Clostridiaceae bacterium]